MSYWIFCLSTGIGLLLSGYSASGQTVLYPVITPADARFDNFPLNKGEGETTTLSVFQDKKGFIWCGTEFGCYRFDGIKYIRYGLGNSDSTLIGFSVNCIFEDSGGFIWAGTAGALNRIDMRSEIIDHFLPDTTDFASLNNTIRLINEDKTGLLWLITDRDIFTFDRKSEAFTRYPLDSMAWHSGYSAVVYETERFMEDKSGKIWIATDNGLYLFKHKENSWLRFFPGDTKGDAGKLFKVNCVKEDNDGNIWFGTETESLFRVSDSENGLYEKVKISLNNIKSLADITVTSVLPESKFRIWIFGNSTLIDYNPVTGESKSYVFSDQSFTFKWGTELRIDKIFRNHNGSLWLINIASGSVFRFDPVTEELSYYNVPRLIDFSCIQDKTGDFWFGAVGQNMFRLVTDSLPFMTRAIPNNDFADAGDKNRISQDERGDLWLALAEGVFKIRDPRVSSELKPEKLKIPSDTCEATSVFRDRKGSIWFGFNKGIVMKYNPEKNIIHKFKLPFGNLTDFLGVTVIISEDRSGNIWFATQNEGLFKLATGRNQIERSITLKDLSGNRSVKYLMDFLIDSNDEFWISTFDGLFRTDSEGKGIKNYTGFDGTGRTYGSFYVRIVEDNNRKIWVLNSLAGPYVYDKENDTFIKPVIPDITSEFGFSDMLFDKHGRLWFGIYGSIKCVDPETGATKDFKLPEKAGEIHSFLLNSGIKVFTVYNKLIVIPEEIPSNKFIPPVYLTSLFINEKEFNKVFPEAEFVTDLKKIDLKFDQNNLKFEFAALNYTHPELNRYKYFMKGIDKDTILAAPGATPEYKQMNPGRYKLWVTGSNNDGLWNPSGVTVDIHINPPWYQSVLAYILYIITIGWLITAYIKFRNYSLQKDKIRLESEVHSRTAELEIKNRQLAEADRLKTHFFTDISHEIRTPLSLIIGPLDTISKEEVMSDRMSGMVEIMKRNALRLMQLVNQLLDISRLDAGRMRINLAEDGIVKCLRIFVYEFLSVAESKQIKYIAELPEKEIITWFDRDKIEKIVSNLLSNAFKFTPTNGTIRCSINIVPRDKDKIQHILNIKVADTGPGIDKENLDRIFDRFFRVEGRNETKGHGTGIGLSLTRDFISLLHGEIRVNSIPGKGSEFLVSLPLGKEHLTNDEFTITRPEVKEVTKTGIINYTVSSRNDNKSKKDEGLVRVLVIEDNEDLRNFIKERLADQYQTLGAENGRTGINMAFTMMPDIIVTDILMPDIDGIKLCTQLKNDERTSHIPIIMLTAKATTDDKLEGLRSGADDYIVKPFIIDELKIRIANLLVIREKLKLKFLNIRIPETISEKPESVDEMFMQKVVRVINENITNFEFDVGILHERMGMSRMHLSRKLKVLTGLSPHVLIRNIRLEKAAGLLIKNAGNITKIAYSVGFSNASGFTKAFRDYFGVSPKKYSKQ